MQPLPKSDYRSKSDRSRHPGLCAGSQNGKPLYITLLTAEFVTEEIAFVPGWSYAVLCHGVTYPDIGPGKA